MSVEANAALPWWRYPMVWLVLGGPAVVVVASLVTLVIAVRFGDPPLQGEERAEGKAMTPATSARNHAGAPRR